MEKQYSYEELVKQLNELTVELQLTKKYGLVWDKEKNKEAVVSKCEKYIPVLERVLCRDIVQGGNENCLLEGDNYHSLVALNCVLGESFDGIYIDPPYNTGEKDDFMYNDKMVDKADAYRHSKWLSFMSKRLILARNLLKDSGVIFISIGDDEFGNLRLLCDSIFGEKNFLGDIVWQSNTQPVNAGRAKFSLQKACDHTFTYCKKKSCLGNFILEPSKKPKQYPFKDEKGSYRAEIIEKRDAGRDKRSSMKFEILGRKPRAGKRWQIGEDTARQLETAGKLIVQDGTVKKKIYKDEESSSVSYKPFWALLLAKDVGSAETGKTELKNALGYDAGFETVKSVGLIKSLFRHLPKDGLYLDFFAGSGTTGQAILELNAEDAGDRRFILCQNEENEICSKVAYPRLKAVITGKREDGTSYSCKCMENLRYFKTGFVGDSAITDQSKYDLVEKTDGMLCILENVFDFVERNDYSSHYYSSSLNKHLFIFNDYYNKAKFCEFKERLRLAEGEKVAYLFSFDELVESFEKEDMDGIVFKPIPSKIYAIYKEIVEEIKRGE